MKKKKNRLFAEILQTVTKYFLILVILVLVGLACSGIRVVESGNVALILRFGKLVGSTPEEQVHEPGLLLAFPYIIDEVVIVPTGNVMQQTITTHYTPDGTKTKDGGYVITGDQNVAVLSASVKYTVSDPVEYALNVDKVDGIVNGCVSSALLTKAAGMDVDILLTSGLDEFTEDSLALANEKVDAANIGITINTLELTEASMAAEVRTIYEKGTSALVEAETIKENARLYKQNLMPQAQTNKQTKITAAQNEQKLRVAEAEAALAEFNGVLEEYEKNPQAVRLRLLTQKTKDIITKIGTIRVVQEGEATILLLPKVEESDGES